MYHKNCEYGDQENIYFKRPVITYISITYMATNAIYPFFLRVLGIITTVDQRSAQARSTIPTPIPKL